MARKPDLHIDLWPEPWQAVNDGVMGGLSNSRMILTEDGLRFEGVLSLENNGGFASVRRTVDGDLSITRCVRLDVRGDGRSYQFRLRLDQRFDSVAWRADFSATAAWQTVELPFDEFIPVFRGRREPEAGPVVAADIRQIGFLLADRRAGPFALDIRAIVFR